jgi:hypothetical protein
MPVRNSIGRRYREADSRIRENYNFIIFYNIVTVFLNILREVWWQDFQCRRVYPEAGRG